MDDYEFDEELRDTTCPECGSSRVVFGYILNREEMEVGQYLECYDCGHKWSYEWLLGAVFN